MMVMKRLITLFPAPPEGTLSVPSWLISSLMKGEILPLDVSRPRLGGVTVSSREAV